MVKPSVLGRSDGVAAPDPVLDLSACPEVHISAGCGQPCKLDVHMFGTAPPLQVPPRTSSDVPEAPSR